MILTNYHTHSHFCDGKEAPEAYVKQAIEKKMSVLGFSGHATVPFNNLWTIPADKLNEYCIEINRLKVKYIDQIEIYCGLEIDYIKDLMGVSTFSHLNLDYTIGSIHFLSMFNNGERFGIDSSTDHFKTGFQQVFKGDIKKMIRFYYHELSEMISKDRPDIIAHFDLIKKFNKNSLFFNENESWYKDIVFECLENVAKSGCIIEVNTRGYFKNLMTDFYPSQWIIKQCKNLNIPVTVDADAHSPVEVDSFLLKARQYLKEAGYNKIMVLKEKIWQEIDN
jgi:histidinol-phosphatase (PHP family)